MAQIENRGTGIPRLLLFLGGFAALILLVTLLVRVVGPSSEGPSAPRLDPVALDASAEADRPPPPPPPTRVPVPAPSVAPTVAPTALPPEPQFPPKRLFADECAEQLFRITDPSHRPYTATDRGPEQPRPPDVRRFTRAGVACACIARVYQNLGVTDLSGEDARATYEEVLSRHGVVIGPALSAQLSDCEHIAR